MKLYPVYMSEEQSDDSPSLLEFGTNKWSVDLYSNLANPDMYYYSAYGVEENLSRVPLKIKMRNYETN